MYTAIHLYIINHLLKSQDSPRRSADGAGGAAGGGQLRARAPGGQAAGAKQRGKPREKWWEILGNLWKNHRKTEKASENHDTSLKNP